MIRGSVSQDTKGFAEVTIQAAIAAIQGNPLPESSIRIEAVTMENVAAYLQAEAASHSTTSQLTASIAEAYSPVHRIRMDRGDVL